MGWLEEREFAHRGRRYGAPVDPLEQGIELRLGQHHRLRLRPRPDEPPAVQALRGQHQVGTVPDQQFQPVGAAGTERVDGAVEETELEVVGDMDHQSVHALAPIIFSDNDGVG